MIKMLCTLSKGSNLHMPINLADLVQFYKEKEQADKINQLDFLSQAEFHPMLHQQKKKLTNKL